MRDFLKALGLEKDAIESIMAEHGKAVTADKAKLAELEEKLKGQGQQGQGQQGESGAPADYKALFKSDKALQDFVRDYAARESEEAVEKAVRKQRRLADEKLSESERLAELSADDLAKYWKEKAEEAIKAKDRFQETEKMKARAASMMNEAGIPGFFLSLIDFDGALAEDVQEKVKGMSEWEYRPRGSYDKDVEAKAAEQLANKLKQAAPEGGDPGGGQAPKPIPAIF
jgi:hypothetical protein